jgi:protein-S-isoprenylcysteine O-methyltransferase Ste14
MRRLRRQLRPRLLASYALVALVILSARPTLGAMLGGLLLIGLGEGLRLWATGYLHKTESLTVSGPYGYIRHPLYLGTLLISTGFVIMASFWAGYVMWGLFLIGYFGYYMPYKNRIEGARLESLFRDDYRRYEAAVPKLCPRLHRYVPLGGVPDDVARWRGVRFADNHETRVAGAVLASVVVMMGRWAWLQI